MGLEFPNEKQWPPKEAPSLEKQSQIVEAIDRLIKLTEEKIETLKHLRAVLVVGFRYAGDSEKFKDVWSKATMHPLGWRHGVQQLARIHLAKIEQWRKEHASQAQ